MNKKWAWSGMLDKIVKNILDHSLLDSKKNHVEIYIRFLVIIF